MKRYNESLLGMQESDKGEWVRYEDVKPHAICKHDWKTNEDGTTDTCTKCNVGKDIPKLTPEQRYDQMKPW